MGSVLARAFHLDSPESRVATTTRSGFFFVSSLDLGTNVAALGFKGGLF